MVSASDLGSQGPGFKSHWRQNSAHDDCTMLHCTEPFIIILPSFQYDLTLVLLNPGIHCFANSVDPDQLASEEAN